MHETSIAIALLEQVLDAARKHEAVTVQEVEVQLGVMRGIVPDALELAFSSASVGTIAEDAKLTMVAERIVAVCNICECLFAPEQMVFTCPQCGQADARIVAGNQVVLKSLTCRTAQEATAI